MMVRLRRGTLAQWTAVNAVDILAAGELGIDTTSQVVRIGDGVTAFLSLPGFAYDTTAAQWSAWADIAGGLFTAPAIQGTPTAQLRTGPGGQIQLRGQIAFNGAYTAGNPLITFPLGQRPPRVLTYSTRTTGTGAAGGTIGIDTAGNLSCSVAEVAGGFVNLEGVTIFTT
jgi:hypothetical protein